MQYDSEVSDDELVLLCSQTLQKKRRLNERNVKTAYEDTIETAIDVVDMLAKSDTVSDDMKNNKPVNMRAFIASVVEGNIILKRCGRTEGNSKCKNIIYKKRVYGLQDVHR